ncbi:Peptide deformylase [Gracilaria domingensis]|nr:Peptide deformylase [Gracilaria domingensis]
MIASCVSAAANRSPSQPTAMNAGFIQSGVNCLRRQTALYHTSSIASHKTLSPRRRRVRISHTRCQANAQEASISEEIDPGVVEGTSLRILKYPHPLLRAENETVDQFDSALKQTVREMLRIMYASKGVGLAAPQVGINKRLMVFNPEGEERAFIQEVVLVNPEIVATSKKTDVEMEACLSFPGMAGRVRRHEWVKVEAQRLNGKRFKTKFEGWKARIFQHEFDHLQKILYVDRLEDEDKPNVKERLAELVEAYRKEPYEGMQPSL